MRRQTDAKRNSIKTAATTVFRRLGYDRSSLERISAEAGASRQTIYNYFPTKETLFTAVVLEAMESQAEALLRLLDVEASDISSTLKVFAEAYIGFISSPDVIDLMRIGVAEGGTGRLGPSLYRQGPDRVWNAVSIRFGDWSRQGYLEAEDPTLAAGHLKALLEAGLVEPLLYGVTIAVASKTRGDRAISAFLAIYGPQV